MYSGTLTGPAGAFACPLHSLCLNPLNFIFWDHSKYLVYETPMGILEDLTGKIVVASADVYIHFYGRFDNIFNSAVDSAMMSLPSHRATPLIIPFL
ncbi:hypothetical protein AVEN_263843-1 [Araneus ventricosus]|uniref:Uncharacterized protein n=1 Tax=Araneus ventricosus TaxID=182803 RepID=A0A4Y2E295_ARAVE|nr:hypothetical protein AVEN_263843-1 [Araneus ventricosus]